MRRRSKRYKEIVKLSTKGKKVEIKEILELVKKTATTKFDESIDISMRINLKQSKGGDFNLRTVIKLPNGSGKKSKIAVLCESDKLDEAKKLNYSNVEIQLHKSEDLEKLYKVIKDKGDSKIKISIEEDDKNYLFELKDRRKFDYETLKNLNKEHYIKKINL